MATVEQYTGLITSEHALRPKFAATVAFSVSPFVAVQNLLASMPARFDVDEAVGQQLDFVGEWVGRSRKVDVPLTGVYFSWDDTADDGWDSGVWQGEYDPTSGLVSLPDDSYRLLLRAKIAANRWDGTIPGAYEVWQQVFPTGVIVIQDNQDMTMDVAIATGNISIVTQQIITQGYIPLKPEGVLVNYSIVPGGLDIIFGLDVESEAMDGWDIGSWVLDI